MPCAIARLLFRQLQLSLPGSMQLFVDDSSDGFLDTNFGFHAILAIWSWIIRCPVVHELTLLQWNTIPYSWLIIVNSDRVVSSENMLLRV